MKKTLIILLVLAMTVSLFGCGEGKNEPVSNSLITIDGVYQNNEYTDSEGLHQILIFATFKPTEEKIDISSAEFDLKINDNSYEAVIGYETPNLTQYYYSNIIEDVEVGKTFKLAMIYKVPSRDLTSGNEMTLSSFDDYAKDIVMKTDNIKKMDNLTKISLDVDKEYATKKQEEENEKLSDADGATVARVQNDINGYYFTFPAYIGTTFVTYKLEFSAPNYFTVSSSLAPGNSGTYRVAKNYIVLHYDSNGKDIYAPYSYESGGIELESPFYSNGSDTTF